MAQWADADIRVPERFDDGPLSVQCECGARCGEGCPCLRAAGRSISPYDESGRLRSADLAYHASETPIMECGARCACGRGCGNRRSQRRVRVPLRVADAGPGKGNGLFSTQDVAPGEFLGVYAGDVVRVAWRGAQHGRSASRHAQAPAGRDTGSGAPEDGHNVPPTYQLTLREVLCVPSPSYRSQGHQRRRSRAGRAPPAWTPCDPSGSGKELVVTVDAVSHGNETRFMNHSCDPNVVVRAVRRGTWLPRAGFFAARPVARGEELCFDYAEGCDAAAAVCGHPGCGRGQRWLTQLAQTRVPCLCGAAQCRGFLVHDAGVDEPEGTGGGGATPQEAAASGT